MSEVSKRVLTLVAMMAAIAAAVLIATSSGARPRSDAAARDGTIRLTLGGPQATRPIQPGFAGLSLEYSALEPYAGSDPAALNPVFLRLTQALAPGQGPVIRIGGDSSDWAWWPVPGMAKPGGVRIDLDPQFAAVTAALAQSLDAKLVLGIDLEANSRALAAKEASELVSRVGGARVAALELGNEPELYGSFAWYDTPSGQRVTGRPKGYSPADFNHDFRSFAGALPRLPLAGPTTGAVKWMTAIPQFVRSVPRLGMITVHRYPLQLCYIPPANPWFPTLAHLFARGASRGLANSVAPYVGLAHGRHMTLRVDEMNTISCGTGSLAHSFASAVWTLDAMFEMARIGADGVNIHSYPGAPYSLFDFTHSGGRWTAHVWPQYYGMLMFARAAPAGARLLQLTGAHPADLHVWATVASDGVRRVVLINESAQRSRRVALAAAGASAGPAQIEPLRAAGGLLADSGVSLGGRTFGASTATGQLAAPVSRTVSARAGRYLVSVPAGSAVLVTLGG